MQIIAFDYGEKKIGVAVGQTSTNTSSPLKIIFNKDNKTNWISISSLLEMDYNPIQTSTSMNSLFAKYMENEEVKELMKKLKEK